MRNNSGVQRDVGFGVCSCCPLDALADAWRWRCLLLGVRFGLAGRFFCVAAHDLLDADRERAPLLDADQGQREEGQPWHWLAIQTGKEPIQAMGVFAGFGGHDFIASQQVDLIWTVHMLTKEHPKQHGPWERLGEKALDGAVTAALARPAGDAQHRDPSRHHQHGRKQSG